MPNANRWRLADRLYCALTREAPSRTHCIRVQVIPCDKAAGLGNREFRSYHRRGRQAQAGTSLRSSGRSETSHRCRNLAKPCSGLLLSDRLPLALPSRCCLLPSSRVRQLKRQTRQRSSRTSSFCWRMILVGRGCVALAATFTKRRISIDSPGVACSSPTRIPPAPSARRHELRS